MNAGKARVEQIFIQLRRRMSVVIALTTGLGILLALFSMRRILGLEAERCITSQILSRAGQELQQLSARLVEAQENERRSISRELHDEVGQALTGVLVEMANLSTLIRAGDEAALIAEGGRDQTRSGELHQCGAQHGTAAASFDAGRFGTGAGASVAGTRGFQAQWRMGESGR